MRYWEERAKEWAKARDKKEHKINAALVDSYKNAADDLQKEIAAWYEKYADAEGISFADAKKRLDERERRALTRSVKAFEKLAKQNKDHSQDKILTKMSAAVHINRLTSMQFQMRYILYELYADVNNALTNGLKEFYADEREQMAYEAQMARGRFEPIATIDEKRISAVLKTPWATDGKDFSARLWNNREQLVSTLQSELTRALITGADSASVAKNIAKKMNAAQYAASRLVSTEITRIITASDIDTFAEMGIDEVEVVGTLDLHTCDTCGDMDSKHMPRTEAKEGTTAPPFHPNCRCVIVPYFGDNEEARATRNPETGKTETASAMTFKEWKEKYLIPKQTKDDYETYKKILRKNMPSIEDFREIRYNKSEWEMFRDYVAGINRGDLTPLASFDLYKSISQDINDRLVGLMTSNGISITGKVSHMVYRVIGSVEQRRNGVQVDDIKEALTSESAEVLPIRDAKAGRSQRFRTAKIEVTINPDTGKLIQANPEHAERRRKR